MHVQQHFYTVQINEMKPASNAGLGLKKGAWTAGEDTLLKNCIEKYGEGKWHLVPRRAGLNRCRKSCRIRWLNYLRPNIKRGDFFEGEVDLILRLHKLLGNRWSLIAGRIPGRTANDVKNYWNTHLSSRFKQQKSESAQSPKVTPYKPQPGTFPVTLQTVVQDGVDLKWSHDGVCSSEPILPSSLVDGNVNKYLLDDLFDDYENEIDGNFGWLFAAPNVVEQEDDQISLFDFSMDEVTRDVINSDQI